MVPHSWHRCMQQLARMLCNKTVQLKLFFKLHLILPSSHDALWFCVQFCARINLATQNIMPTILNALLLGCTKSTISSMQIGFLMALAGVPVGELFDIVGY